MALGLDIPPWSTISWVDVVKEKGYYFHPADSKGWPKVPPNYIAFRYHGELQSIHHIEDYQVVTELKTHIPEMNPDNWEPHLLYTLGPGFKPEKKVKTGKLFRNGRVWCMLDTLFTCDTISDAAQLSKQR